MEHFGQVLEHSGGNKALVRVRHNSACGNCGRCSGFLGDPEQNQYHLVEVLNPVGAGKGQFVRLETRSGDVLLAACLLYLVPLIALLIGLFIGRGAALYKGLAGSTDVWGLGTGLLFMALTFLLLHLQEKRLARGKRFKASITAVVSEEEIPEHARLPVLSN